MKTSWTICPSCHDESDAAVGSQRHPRPIDITSIWFASITSTTDITVEDSEVKLKVSWRYHITNKDIVRQTGLISNCNTAVTKDTSIRQKRGQLALTKKPKNLLCSTLEMQPPVKEKGRPKMFLGSFVHYLWPCPCLCPMSLSVSSVSQLADITR